MKNAKRNLISLLIIVIVLQSCCVVEEPEFNIYQLPDAILNQEYKLVIVAHVKNNPDDNNFEYSFSFTDGLPEGVTIYIIPGNRRIIIEGTPIEYGEFKFVLSVRTKQKEIYETNEDSSGDFYDLGADIVEEAIDDAICSIGSDKHSHSYILNVTMM